MLYLTEEERHYEKYIDVAMQLLTTRTEVSPSARALIERVGGSMTTANKAMQVFWGYVGRRLSYDQKYPDGMPLEIIKLMEKTMAIARDAAKKELQSEWKKVAEQTKKLEENRAALEQAVECLTQELSENKKQLDENKKYMETLYDERASLKQQLITATIKNDALTLANTIASTELEGIKRELSNLKRDRENLAEQLKESNEHQQRLLNEMKEKNERIIAIERQNQTMTDCILHHTEKETEYKEALDQRQKTIQRLENQNATNQEMLNEKNIVLARMEIEVRESKRYNLKLETDLEAHIKHHSHLENQLSNIGAELLALRPLKLRLGEVMEQVSDLRCERDRLIQLLDKKSSIPKRRLKKVEVGAAS